MVILLLRFGVQNIETVFPRKNGMTDSTPAINWQAISSGLTALGQLLVVIGHALINVGRLIELILFYPRID
jgi:hypothetical protein